MKPVARKRLGVYAHWEGLPEPTRMGFLYATLSRGQEIFSFAYDEAWLRAGAIIKEVVGAVRGWRSVATALGIPAGERDRMSRAFRVAEEQA